MASLGIKPDLLARAIEILTRAVNLMELGYTVEARAVDNKGLPTHPIDSTARKWRLDGALVAATARVYQENGLVHEDDSIDLTVANTHPWCGVNMADIVSTKSRPDAIWMTTAIIDALARNRQRVLAQDERHLAS